MNASANLLRGLGWVLLCILVWAPMFSIGKRVLPVVDPFSLATLRYAIGSVLLVALLWAIEGRQALRYEGRLVPATVFGVIGIACFNLFLWCGLALTRPEHAAIIMAMQTPLIAIGVWLARGQRPPRFVIGCIVAVLAGVLLVVTKGDPASAFVGGAILGDALVFLGALSWVIYTLSAGRFAGWSPLRLTVLTCIPGAAGLFIANGVAVAVGASTLPGTAAVASIAWQIVYFSAGTVVLGILAFNFAVRHLGPLNAMLSLNLIPVCVFAIEAALGRSFAGIELSGAALVVGALVANNLYLRRVSSRG